MIVEVDVIKSNIQKGILYICFREQAEEDWESPIMINEEVAKKLLLGLSKVLS